MKDKEQDKKHLRLLRLQTCVDTIAALIGMYTAAGVESARFTLSAELWEVLRSKVPVGSILHADNGVVSIRCGGTIVYKESKEYHTYVRARFYKKMKFGDDF